MYESNHSQDNALDLVELGDELVESLLALEEIDQDPLYHPEGDVLYHVLQVFELAHKESHDPELWAAALFHDVGKAVSIPEHAAIGADQLSLDFSPRVTWLVRHHMDLLYHPKRTRKMWSNTPQLAALEQLRRWDLAGRSPYAHVMSPETAVEILLAETSIFCGSPAIERTCNY